MDHTSRAVLAQQQVGGAPEEVSGVRPLLADLDLHGVVVTADALHTHPEAAEFLVIGKQAHYLFQVKPTSPPCWPAAPACRGTACPCWIAPATRRTAASRCAPSRPSPSTTSGSPTPPRSCRSPARPGTCALRPHPGGGGPWSSTRSPASASPRPAPPDSPISSVGTGRSRSVKQAAPMGCDR